MLVFPYDASLPQPRQAALSFNLGPLALQYLLRAGGSGYFRTRAIERFLADGTLEKVTEAPEFTHPVFLVYQASPAAELDVALAGFRALADQNEDWLV